MRSQIIWKVRKDSRRADTRAAPGFVPINKKDAVRLYYRAVDIERASRAKGKQDGRITRNGLAVLRTLLFEFLNRRSGRCDPSYADIARAAAISVRSVARGLSRLKIAGVLQWVRRCIGRDTPIGFRLEQISNAYEILLKLIPLPPKPHYWGQPEKMDDGLEDAIQKAREDLANLPGDRLVQLRLLALENLRLRSERNLKLI